MGNGSCRRESCNIDDPKYVDKEAEKECRRNDLLIKERERRREEQIAARNIRRQTKTSDMLLREEIKRLREKMERYYTRGFVRAADKLSREIGQLERRI